MIGSDLAHRPLAVADILDIAVTRVARHWRAVATLCALYAMPDALVRAFNHGAMPAGSAPVVLSLLVDFAVSALIMAAIVRVLGDPNAPSGVIALLVAARRDYRRSLAALLVYAALFMVPLLAGAGAVVVTWTVASQFGGLLPAVSGAVTVALVVVVLLVAPLCAASIAYPTVILERVGAWRGIRKAWSRVMAGGTRHTWLLGVAFLVVGFGPGVVVEGAVQGLGGIPGLWWVGILEPFAVGLTATAFWFAVATVASVDYRNRRDGADLHAAIDVAETA